MRTVALISEHASPLACAGGIDCGGQNVYVAHVARQLTRRNVRVDVFTRRDDPALPRVVALTPMVRVIHLDAGPPRPVRKEQLLPHMAEFADGLSRACAERRYDVLHANFFMSGLAGLKAMRRHGLPLVMTFHALGRVRRQHQNGEDLFPDRRFEIEDQLVREADRLIAECPQDRADLLHHYGADPGSIDVVPCGYDPREIHPIARAEARRALGWKEGEFCLLQLGRMVPRKGVDNVVRALALLRERHGVRARLYVVGGETEQPDPQATPEIGRLQALARDCGVERQVSFLGRRGRQALCLHYSAADVFVTTPWYEPFGITPVEAMACGIPVVGSDVGGIRSTVVDGSTGLLVPPRDPAALAQALATLAADALLRRRMGQAGRIRAQRSYTWQHVCNGLALAYERAITRRAPRCRPPLAAGEGARA